MLTEEQEQYLSKIPDDAIASIKPWDPIAANFAKSLIKEIEQNSGLELFWEGSLALGIQGENDIDLIIFSEPMDFDKHLPTLIRTLGKPTYVLTEKILWRITKDGYKIDASLTSKNNPAVKLDILFFTSLKKRPTLLKEYAALKIPGLSAREYYKLKNEFYNQITNIK